MLSFIKSIFGFGSKRKLKKYYKILNNINSLEDRFKGYSDQELQDFSRDLIERSRKDNTILPVILPEAYALVREASVRTLGLRHYDVQMIGGISLFNDKIAEMKTGEGKTLTSTLPIYLRALAGRGVHIITVNDYLAHRDALSSEPLFNFLGLTVGVNLSTSSDEEKKHAYNCDITYGTNNEFAFDYLRDNMASSLSSMVQRSHYYCIIDEVDSILIDEARTPLIISGSADDFIEHYIIIAKMIEFFVKQDKEDTETSIGRGDFWIDEKSSQANLTERGLEKAEKMLFESSLMPHNTSLYSSENISLLHKIISALKAKYLFENNVHYIVQNDSVIIVDEHTGRLTPGRRWSDGLHQSIEAKEGVTIQKESMTLASITFQNYFRLYDHLSGMTGTAVTEEYEFKSIYNLDTLEIPTHKPMVRKDHPDVIYMSEREKHNAIIKEIIAAHKKQQPVLVGTASIESSEVLSAKLKKEKIKHNVLNAKNHEHEADIISNAGCLGAVTIATNMAGRGTDIILGGNLKSILSKLVAQDKPQSVIDEAKKKWEEDHQKALDIGGLYVIGAERHESRRIDNQLRGRSGRQGDNGVSKFYISMEDDLMRIFASPSAINFIRKVGMEEGEAIEHRILSNAIEKAQRRVEVRNFEIRKHLIEYDDVINNQRQIIYDQRNSIMSSSDIDSILKNIFNDSIKEVVEQYCPDPSMRSSWDISSLNKKLNQDLLLDFELDVWASNNKNFTLSELQAFLFDSWYIAYDSFLASYDFQADQKKSVLINSVDSTWRNHLSAISYLRQGIHLRSYANKNPKEEYKIECFSMFNSMIVSLKYNVMLSFSKLFSLHGDL